jgi:hypothetical protein
MSQLHGLFVAAQFLQREALAQEGLRVIGLDSQGGTEGLYGLLVAAQIIVSLPYFPMILGELALAGGDTRSDRGHGAGAPNEFTVYGLPLGVRASATRGRTKKKC